jgi:hypothetical protein
MHLDDERIQRLLHEEVEPAVAVHTRRHLDECAACRQALDAARRDEERIFALLRRLDHPQPAVDPRALIRDPRQRSGWSRWAAAILLGASIAGVAYAAPGSPLPAVLGRMLGAGRATQNTPSAELAGPVAPAAGAGIAVEPGDALVIRFESAGDAIATVALTDDELVEVRALEGSASFSSDVDRLAVRSSDRARFEIRIPRSASSVEVLAGPTSVFRQVSGRVVSASKADSSGRYTISLGAGSP